MLHNIKFHFITTFRHPQNLKKTSNSLEFKKQPLSRTVISKFPNPCYRCCQQHSVCRPKRGRHLCFHFAKKQKNIFSSVPASGKKALLNRNAAIPHTAKAGRKPFSQPLFSKPQIPLFRFNFQLPAKALWGCG